MNKRKIIKSKNGERNKHLAYKKHLEDIKEFKKNEREEYKQIKDYENNEIVLLTNKRTKNQYQETVIKVYDKSYKISFGLEDYVLIDKKSLFGYPNSINKSYTGDGRRFVGEEIYLSKLEKD